VLATERVELLLRTYEEALGSFNASSGDGGPTLMASDWALYSYPELERCLHDLRDSSRRPLWWHVSHRYLRGEERTIICAVSRRRHHPDVFNLPPFTELVAGGPAIGSRHAQVRVYQWTERVDQGKVRQGIRLLSRTMYGGRQEKIKLPPFVLKWALSQKPLGRETLVA